MKTTSVHSTLLSISLATLLSPFKIHLSSNHSSGIVIRSDSVQYHQRQSTSACYSIEPRECLFSPLYGRFGGCGEGVAGHQAAGHHRQAEAQHGHSEGGAVVARAVYVEDDGVEQSYGSTILQHNIQKIEMVMRAVQRERDRGRESPKDKIEK